MYFSSHLRPETVKHQHIYCCWVLLISGFELDLKWSILVFFYFYFLKIKIHLNLFLNLTNKEKSPILVP